jgi:hypothetical protein
MIAPLALHEFNKSVCVLHHILSGAPPFVLKTMVLILLI